MIVDAVQVLVGVVYGLAGVWVGVRVMPVRPAGRTFFWRLLWFDVWALWPLFLACAWVFMLLVRRDDR